MPMYEFQCQDCGKEFSLTLSLKEREVGGMECPGCKRQLEVAPASRMLATTLGLLAAALVWRLARAWGGTLGWVLPMVYSFFAFSAVAPLFLMFTADLRTIKKTA